MTSAKAERLCISVGSRSIPPRPSRIDIYPSRATTFMEELQIKPELLLMPFDILNEVRRVIVLAFLLTHNFLAVWSSWANRPSVVVEKL